jgi:uncharacterized protein with GYD domain
VAPYEPAKVDRPPAEPRAASNTARIVLWLIMLSLLVFFLPLYLLSATVKEDNANLEAELTAIQGTLQSPEQIAPEEQALTDTLLHVREQIIELEAVRTDVLSEHIDWPAVMLVIGDYDPMQMQVSGIAQTDFRVALSGQADDEAVVTAYLQRLRESGQFATVTIQAISLRPLPTPTLTPGNPPGLPSDSGRQSVVEFTISLELKVAAP